MHLHKIDNPCTKRMSNSKHPFLAARGARDISVHATDHPRDHLLSPPGKEGAKRPPQFDKPKGMNNQSSQLNKSEGGRPAPPTPIGVHQTILPAVTLCLVFAKCLNVQFKHTNTHHAMHHVFHIIIIINIHVLSRTLTRRTANWPSRVFQSHVRTRHIYIYIYIYVYIYI